MMVPSTDKLTSAQLEKWIGARVGAIVEVVGKGMLSEAAGMLRGDNFGLAEVLTVRVCAVLGEPAVLQLCAAMNESVAREHRMMRDMARHRRELKGGGA